MKLYSNKLLTTVIGGAALLFTACQEGDNVIDTVFDDTERGAILRTINVTSNELPIGASDSFFGGVFEIQDQEDGTLVDFVEVYVGFRDNTDNGGPDNDRDQVLVETIDKSTFTLGEFGLPRLSYEITLPEMQSALGLTAADVDGGDQFEIRFELVLNDGRRFSRADNSATLTGSFFASPFLYVATVVCPPKPPAAGDWTIIMRDSYGDGWQTTTSSGGPGLTLTLDTGQVFEVGLCTPYEANTYDCTAQASEGTATITVPAGATSGVWFFPGDFWGEISFTIITPSGNIVGDFPAGTAAGELAINFCLD